MYNIGLIGCGYMGQSHLTDISHRENINIYAVCDTDSNLADCIAQRYGAKVYYDAQDLIDDSCVDIVIIATYPSTHLPLLKKCIENGKHVLCEKPIGESVEQADEFKRLLAESKKSKVLVGYILRHNDTYIKIKELISAGAIGSPIVMRMVHNQNTCESPEKFRHLIEETSPIIDCGVHYIDLMRWFTGEEVVWVDGVGAKTDCNLSKGKYNYGNIAVTLSGGSVGFYEAGWGETFKNDATKEFIGPLGRIELTYMRDRGADRDKGNLITVYRNCSSEPQKINIPFVEKPTGQQLQYLIEMIEKDIPATPSVEDVIESFVIACKADQKIIEKLGEEK